MDHLQGEYCKNCRNLISPGQKFCVSCGQKSDTPRITVKYLVQDFLRIILHGERGIGNLLVGLASRPGRVVTEYVEGKRKKYFNPFSFLAVCIAIMVLINGWLSTNVEIPVPNQRIAVRMPDEKTKGLYLLTVKRMADAENFFNKNVKFGTLITAPFYAFFLWLFFKRRGRNIAEIAVTYILLTSFNTLLFTAITSPLLYFFAGTAAHNYIYWTGIVLEAFYYAWGLKTFFGYRTAGGYFRLVLAIWLIGLIGLVFVIILLYIYVYHGGASVVLRYM